MTDCNWTEKVSLLIDGELAAAEARAVELHVAGCFDCQLAREDFLLLRHQISSYRPEVNLLAQRQALQNILGAGASDRPARARAAGWRERAASVFALPRLGPALVAASALLVVALVAGLVVFRGGRSDEMAKRERPAAAPVGASGGGATAGQQVPNPAATTSPAATPDEGATQGATEDVAKYKPKGVGGIKVAKFQPKGVTGTQLSKGVPPKGVKGLEKNLETARLPREVEDVPFIIPPRVSVEAREFSESDLASLAEPKPDADPADLSAARHAEQAQQLLRSFRNSDGDVSFERKQSQELLYRNIVLRREAARAGKSTVEGVLDSLEPILVDIANLPDKPAREEVRSITDRMQKKNIVAMLQIAARD
jgi:Putative zinc-finger